VEGWHSANDAGAISVDPPVCPDRDCGLDVGLEFIAALACERHEPATPPYTRATEAAPSAAASQRAFARASTGEPIPKKIVGHSQGL
jgi:hypothetical protein